MKFPLVLPFVVIIASLSARAAILDFEEGTSTDVPAPFVYDPLTGRSVPNGSSTRLNEDVELTKVDGSFTLEAFVKPSGVPAKTMDLFVVGDGKSGSAPLAAAGVRWISNLKQCYWAGAVTPAGSDQTTRWSTGHYVSISRLREETLGWRHLALVYDAKKRAVTVWLDHWQARTEVLAEALDLTSAGVRVRADFEGLLDSVRLTPKVLAPEHFLHATATALQDVSFESRDQTFPAGAGHLNIRQHFGAVGDGVTDDTAAIQRAFAAVDGHQASSEGTYVLHFPAGKYLVSDTVKWSRFLRVQGESSDNTAILLADNTPGFGDPEKPKPVVAASAVNGPPGSNSAVNGSTIANWFWNFTVFTGAGNPGAVGVEFHSNNYGSLENVRIRSGDGAGVLGLDLSHKTNGPTLISNVKIEGFDTGIKTRYMEYSITMEDVTLLGQKVVGIDNRGNILALRRIFSENAVPVIRSGGGSDMVTLLDSQFSGGAADAAAIESEGALYARNVSVDGYGKSIAKSVTKWNPRAKPPYETTAGSDVVGNIEEYIGDNAVHPEGGAAMGLGLPIENSPEVPVGDLNADWVNVRDFADLVVGDGKEADWAAAIEAAFATGKPTVYFPRGPYAVSRTVVVPPTVKRLYGMDNGIAKGGMADKRNPGYGTMAASLRIEGETDDALLLDFFSVSMIEHASRRPLILQHGRCAYRGLAGAGKVFLRDALGPWWSFSPGQKVWARQWNVESHADGPCVIADGATIWSLGFKTEYESQKLRATNGSAVEIFGGFIYPVVKDIPKDRPVFEVIDSKFAGQWGLSVYVASHDLQVRDVRAGKVRETSIKETIQLGPRRRMDWYSND